MVGVAGRSKGCLTCKKRRIKCDETHPTCIRCQKSGLSCAGYKSGLSFVSQNKLFDGAREKRKYRRTTSVVTDTPNAVFIQRSRDRDHDIKLESADLVDESMQAIPRRTAQQLTPNLFEVLDLSAFRDDMQISFTLQKFLCYKNTSPIWLDRAVDQSNYPLANLILRAIANQFFGKVNRLDQCQQDGTALYVKALKDLSSALSSREALSTPVLVSVMIASYYELIASSDYQKSCQHLDGVARIIQLRGPASHQGRFELEAFSHMRMMICLKHMWEHKRVFLEEPDWKTIPWSRHPPGKTLVERMYDILCDIPGLWEDVDKLHTMDLSDPTYNDLLTNVQCKLSDLLIATHAWRDSWNLERHGSWHEAEPLFPESPVISVLNFDSLEDAMGLFCSHAGFLTLISIGRKLLGNDYDYRDCLPENMRFMPLSSSRIADDIVQVYAEEILQSVEYFLNRPDKSLGSFSLIFPLKKAMDFIPATSVSSTWYKIVYEHITDRNGFSFAGNVI